MVERKEGFWWVRLPKHTGRDCTEREGWCVAELRIDRCSPWLITPGLGCGVGVPLEWGPYLGTEPAKETDK